jgi:hypothetical protein
MNAIDEKKMTQVAGVMTHVIAQDQFHQECDPESSNDHPHLQTSFHECEKQVVWICEDG